MTFQYLSNGFVHIGHFDGEHRDALEAAIHTLSAEWNPDVEEYEYTDPLTGDRWRVDYPAMLIAGSAILSGIPFWDWYTVWAKWNGEPVRG